VKGIISLLLPASLHIRAKDLSGIDPMHWPPSRTRLELAVLLRRTKVWPGYLKRFLEVVADGAYAWPPYPNRRSRQG
jgi:hypothetical protein